MTPIRLLRDSVILSLLLYNFPPGLSQETIRTLGRPRPPGCKKLRGCDAWRIRIGDYRAIYKIHDGQLIVTVITIGHRKEVYE